MRSEVAGFLTAAACVIIALFVITVLGPTTPLSSLVQSAEIHLAWAMVVLAALLLVVLAWKRAILVLGCAAMILAPQFAAPARPTIVAEGTQFKLITFNILGNNTANGQAIADFLIAQSADAVFIQEAGPLEQYLGPLSQTYPERIGCGIPKIRCDLMMLSKTPLTNPQVSSLSSISPDRLITAQVQTPDGPLWLVAPHLTKPYFDEYGIDELNNLARIINRLQGPLLVAGDFNLGSQANAFKGFLRDAGVTPAPNQPATWPTIAVDFGIAIDHVAAREPAQIISTTAIENPMGSNHRGLISEIAFANR